MEEELSTAVSLLPIAFFLPANWERKDEERRFARRSLREPRSPVSLDPSRIERRARSIDAALSMTARLRAALQRANQITMCKIVSQGMHIVQRCLKGGSLPAFTFRALSRDAPSDGR
jgi:hypothetical protein